MSKGNWRRLIIVLLSFAIGIGLEYLWLGKDAFEAFGIILLAIFVAPILLLLMYLDQLSSRRVKK